MNGYFYGSLNEFYRRNCKQQTSNFQIASSIFNAFINAFVHEKLFNDWGTLPLIRLNSTGFGICDKQSIILGQIFYNFGFPTRIIYLNGHVVCEIYYDKAWHLFDPDTKIFFSNNNIICSYNQIIQNPDIAKKNNYSYVQYFLTQDDNKFEEISQPNNDTFLLMLPKQSKLIFPYDPDIYTDFYPYNTKAKLFLYKGYSGHIKNPLVLIDAEGNGIITIGKQTFIVPQQRELLKAFIYSSKKFINKVHIQVHSDSLALVYMLNPQFCKLFSKNTLWVNASDTLNIQIYKHQKDSSYSPIHIHLLKNKYTSKAFYLQKNITLNYINTLDDLYKYLKNYYLPLNIDTNVVKHRFRLIKPLINIPLNKFSDDPMFFVYLAVIFYSPPEEFKNLFLFEYKKHMYKKIISHFNLYSMQSY